MCLDQKLFYDANCPLYPINFTKNQFIEVFLLYHLALTALTRPENHTVKACCGFFVSNIDIEISSGSY